MTRRRLAPLLALLLGAAHARAEPRPGIDWPSFRGIRASGLGGESAPLAWDARSGRGVLWKAPLSGLGHSSPAIWGELVCVTTAVGPAEPQLRVGLYGDVAPVAEAEVHEFRVICLDKRSGARRWEATAHRGVPRIRRHPKSTHANPTAALDARRVVAFFGSEGLYAYDHAGRLLWKRDLGRLDSGFFMAKQAQWGFGSSPVIHDDVVIVQADVQQGSFLAAFDLADGKERWRTARADVPTWSTPTVDVGRERGQVIVNGWKHIGGYDLASGRELWRMRGGGDIPVPTPVVAEGLAFITNAHGPAAPIYAVRTSAAGDVTLPEGARASEHVAWSHERDGAYMQTPLVLGAQLYNCRDNGVLSVYEATSGRRSYQQRLGEGRTGFTASPVAAAGRVYFTSEEGDVYVVAAGPEFALLATNPLGEVTLATPAISEGVIYFRTRDHLVAVGEAGAP